MKKLIATLLFLFGLVASVGAQETLVGWVTATDCGQLFGPRTLNVVCLQLENNVSAGRTKGVSYTWNGTAWIEWGGGGSGSPSFSTVTSGANTTAAMVVGSGASLSATGSGTIAATTSAALAANGANCGAGLAASGVNAAGAAEDCFAPTAAAAGTDTQVQFNDGGSALGATAGLTFNKTTSQLLVKGGIIGNITTASSLAANGSNCGAGQAASGVDAAGNSENCFTPSASAAGTDTQVQFNDGGTALGGDAGMTFNKSTNVLTVTGGVTANASTASALAANGSNCSAGSAPLGVNASGAAETCTDYMEEPASSGIVARTAANTAAARTITGTANNISVSNGDGVSGNPTIDVGTNVVKVDTPSTWIPPLVTVATLPATPSDGQEVTVTDALTATDCEVPDGSFRNRCVWNSGTGHWELVAPATTAQTLDAVMTAGNTTSHCTDSTPCKLGNGTVFVNIYCNDLNVCYNETSEPSDLYLRARTDKKIHIYDEANAADILLIHPAAGTTLGMYTFGTAYKPKKTIDFPASSLTTDTAQCASPALATINSGAPRYTIICTENDASSIYGEVVMPKAWDGLTVTFTHRYVQTAADTGSMFGDIAASCRLATATINNTFGTEIAIDDAAVTGSNAIDMTTSAAVTPNGTCTAGTSRLLQFRWQYDATANPTTAAATLHHLGFTMEYSVTSLSD